MGRPRYSLRDDPDRVAVALIEAQRLIWIATSKQRETGPAKLRGEFPRWNASFLTVALLWPQLPTAPKNADHPPPREANQSDPTGRCKPRLRSLKTGYIEQSWQTGGRPRGEREINRPQDPFHQAVDRLRSRHAFILKRGGNDLKLILYLAHMWVYSIRPDIVGCRSAIQAKGTIDHFAECCEDYEAARFVKTFIERLAEASCGSD